MLEPASDPDCWKSERPDIIRPVPLHVPIGVAHNTPLSLPRAARLEGYG